jgi:arylsulfatase A-like enzyme
MTGRYNWRSPLQSGVLGGLSPRLIEPDRTTIAAWLRDRGYHTACIGKWHLGMNWHVLPGHQITPLGIESREQVFNVDYGRPITAGPRSVGFDYFFGISASLDMVPYAFIENEGVTQLPTEDRDFPMLLGGQPRRTRKGPTAPEFEADQVLDTLIDRSIQYLEQRRGAAKEVEQCQPFFLYLPLASPHTPIVPTEPWRGASGINPYADFVMQTDAAVGRILGALDRLELAEDTVVIVTSDNGCSPEAQLQELAAHQHFPSGPFRGHKADLFEGGTRVPMLIRLPGVIAPGHVSDQLVCQTDLFATLAEWLGEALPDDCGEDSFSFLHVLQGREPSVPIRTSLVSHSINGSFAIRRGRWKLLLCPDSGGWSLPRPGSPEAEGLAALQLYDLEEDVGEQHNRWEQQPELARELLSYLQRLVDLGRSTPGQPQANSVPVDASRQRVERRK